MLECTGETEDRGEYLNDDRKGNELSYRKRFKPKAESQAIELHTLVSLLLARLGAHVVGAPPATGPRLVQYFVLVSPYVSVCQLHYKAAYVVQPYA